MQATKQEYEAGGCDVFKAICVRQPVADFLLDFGGFDGDSEVGLESVLLVGRKTDYRGDLLVCSTQEPNIRGRLCGYLLGRVEVYGCVHVEELEQKALPIQRGKYALLLREPRRVVEFPVKGQAGIFNLYWTAGEVTEYPRRMSIGADGWKVIGDKMTKGQK